MAKVVTLNPIDPITFEYQDYSAQDDNLIVNFTVEPTFNPLQNYVAYYIYDLNNNVIFDNEVNFDGYSIINGQVVLNPEGDVEKAGYEEGQYNVVYNFLNNELSSSFFQRLYIDQISPDRTEIRLNTTQISNLNLISGATSLINQIQSNLGVYFDFFLNFGDNQLIIANNMLLDTSNPEDPTVLVKLYEPLPINFVLKDECWVVTEVAETVAYNVNITQTFELADGNIYLKGPNLNLNIKDQINNSTAYTNYATLSSSSYATGSTNLQYQINSILAERGIEINVDYSDYNNFIYFSSALTRLENFYYKLQLIEEYNYSASLSNLAGPSAYVVTSKNIWEEKINEIITTFDGYDYFLYYESGSASWPKTNSTYPYNNATTNSAAGIAFIQSQSIVAGEYDENNNNALINAIPSYLREDSANAQYELFIEMLGEMFDNIWIYYQDVTEKWNADNRLQYGVSKDIVAEVLRDLGLKIYESSFGSADLYTALLGVTPSGSDFPFPYMTGSLPAPTGFEYINSSISASNQVVPLEDIEKGTYKRLYHNLPMLLKKKGTTVGIQDLITTYGIPSTILRVAEFGGKDKDESNDWDYYKQRYNNAYNHAELADWIGSEFRIDNSYWVTQYTTNRPETVLFRFKTPGVDSAGVFPSQSLFTTDQGVLLALQYSGSINASGSWSGSAINPYNEYAYLTFYPDAGDLNTTASVYLPFFNGGWWTTAITVNNNTGGFTLYAANNIYDGDDGSTIGFIASSSVNGNFSVWESSISASLGSRNGTQVSGFEIFSGSFQELRYYTTAISDNSFRDITMNPDSIESTTLNSSPNQLAFRASLGGELYTGSVSIHPKVTGSWVATSSFGSNSNFYIGNPNNFVPNVETVYLDQPAAGIKNIVSNKIQIVDTIIASGNTINTGSLGTNVLSQYRSIQQQPPGGSTYTENLAYTEVAFSPQNEINDDIMDQLGFFNMGEFIGDPRQRFTEAESYPDLDALRNAYFEKYINNYDLNDYIRLIKFFDNSLFKMIKDFTPARASLASGVVVKQHLLERNKYPQPEVGWDLYDYSGSILMGTIEGGAGGSVNNLNTPWYHFSASIAFGNIDSAYTSLYVGGDFDPISAGFFNFNGAASQGTFTNETEQDIKVRFRITLDNTDLPTVFSCSYSSSTQVVAFPPIDLPADGITYETFSPYIIIPNGETFKFIVKDNGSAGIGINNVSTTIIGQSLVNPYVGQVWKETIVIPSGVVIQTHDSQDEFYNGEFSGSEFVVENGELNAANPAKQVSTVIVNYQVSGSNNTNPGVGEIYWNVGVPSGFSPVFGTQFVDELYINEVDTNGLNIQEALSNLTPGESITFPIQYQTLSIINKTVTGIITNVSPIGTAIWRIRLAYSTGVNGTDVSYNPLASFFTFLNTSGNIILNPFLNNIPGFNNSDYNAIINNADFNRLSEWYQQVDYATAQTVPVNFEQIISGTAYPAAVQDSNYTSYQYSGIRYWGSKNTTDNFNSAFTSQSLVVQNYQNGNIGITTLGAPSTENLTNVGLYYQWAGGTDPEVPGKTNFQIKFMFDAQGNVFLPDLSSSYYNDLLNAFPQNSQINVIPYNPLTGTSANVQVQNSIQGIQTVFWPGVYFNAYLTTQSGSTFNDDFVTTSLRFQNVAQNDFDNLTISNYIFTTASGDSSTLIASSNWGAIIGITLDGYVSSSTNFQYYQVPSTESNPNRAGFDFNNTLIIPSPWIFSPDVSFAPFISGSFNTFPDLVRVQDVSSGDDYQYYSIVSGSAIYGSAVPSIKLANNIASKYITSQGRVNKITFLRLVPSPEKLYINVNKAAGESGPGFILPLYPTNELINNFPNIIKDLSEKNLI